MRVTLLSESPADEAAVRILVEAVLGEPVELAPARSRRAGGIDGALSILGPVLKSLHYLRHAEALVVVVDSNSSPVHTGPTDRPCANAARCRLCRTRSLIAEVRDSLTPVPGQGPIRTAVGLAVPAIEAWYLCGREPNVSENAWAQGMREDRLPYTKSQLKKQVYGSERYSLAMETRRATDQMRRVAGDLGLLERKFPVGFGSLASDLRGWS